MLGTATFSEIFINLLLNSQYCKKNNHDYNFWDMYYIQQQTIEFESTDSQSLATEPFRLGPFCTSSIS
jgi:hypothetical protein